MARPLKQGLDYFPLNVDFLSDVKIRKIMRACGTNSIAILISLLGNIYKDGYYILWDSDMPFLISDEVGVSEGAVCEVVNKALQVGAFHQDIYDKHEILTSKGIQERFYSATVERNKVDFDEKICLLDKTKLERRNINIVNRPINEVIRPIYIVNRSNNEQRKVKESKEINTSSPDTAVGGAVGEKVASHGKSGKQIYDHDSKYYKAAEWLANRVLENTPRSMKAPTGAQKQKWADTFRLMETADNLLWDDIRAVLYWAVNDEFWRAQILSAGNFRKHYNQLAAKMGGFQKPHQPETSGYESADVIIREECERLGISL